MLQLQRLCWLMLVLVLFPALVEARQAALSEDPRVAGGPGKVNCVDPGRSSECQAREAPSPAMLLRGFFPAWYKHLALLGFAPSAASEMQC